ncbi:hypothetical protein [Lysobacter enzymogenes]|uniref:hypothetical protein n=1 Tax=Lysobacter enzymogenes TaxID=69 RepID=UPI00089BC8AF|nr:hypothetical protein [Lysobacter enzymogenes]SDW94638.1 hypothetical protein SAMN05421681_103302 [Lysobacter enzymogenes]
MARPEHQPTKASRLKVAIAAGGGMRHEEIANALGISAPTLRKHYELELSTGAAEKRMEVLTVAFRTAVKKGNTSAARLYLQHAPEFEPAPGAAQEPEAAEPKPEGKKAQANAAAIGAETGTEWEHLLDPKVVPIGRAAQ